MGTSCLHKTFLKSSHSLRTQLLLCFGSTAFLSLAIVVILACTTVYSAARTVKDRSTALLREQLVETNFVANKLVAEKLTVYMNDMAGTVQLIAEAVQDRIVGYPKDGWEEDRYVPFFDVEGQSRLYPLKMPPARLDWDLIPNVNESNAYEHFQERGEFLLRAAKLSSASASYVMQGSCDPSASSPEDKTYYPNCTDESNNLETGGKLQPTLTNRGLHAKSGDLTVFLKALFEAQFNALMMGVYFANAGAGASLQYPGHVCQGAYVSIGCDWMRAINPQSGEPFATDEEIARCHPTGMQVPRREYNPMERDWCRVFALNEGAVDWYGPYPYGGHGTLIMTVGKGVFDRKTGHFIGCVSVDISVSTLSKTLAASVLNGEHRHTIVLARYDGGLVSDSLDSIHTFTNDTSNCRQAGCPIPRILPHLLEQTSELRKASMNMNGSWANGAAVDKAFRSLPAWSQGLVTGYPVPLPEDPSEYRPTFFVMSHVTRRIFRDLNEVNDGINQGVLRIVLSSVVLALIGMVVLVTTIWLVSRMLTRPLLWIEGVAWSIVNHNDVDEELQVIQNSSPTVRWAPQTEINKLVAEFKTMIHNFSGAGASKVADSDCHEILNDLTWHSGFQQLYAQEKNDSFTGTSDEAAGAEELSDIEEGSALEQQSRHGVLARPTNESAKVDGTQLAVPPPLKRNYGSLIRTTEPVRETETWASALDDQEIRLYKSKLFWWTIVLIVMPLLVTNALICGVISNQILSIIPSWVNDAASVSVQIEKSSLELTARSKADVMSAVVFESVRDLHLLTRIAGWLFFGGITRSDGLTEMVSLTDECKVYPKGACPAVEERLVCSCTWEDFHRRDECIAHNGTLAARYLEKKFFVAPASDADPITGARNKSSYPETDASDADTAWWTNLSQVPGAWKGAAAAGFGTTYDRLRVSSSMAIVEPPLYNYATSLGREKQLISVYMGFEDDGQFNGFSGCNDNHAGYAKWMSTTANRAHAIAPELCPLGKHGYDPRCRGWYATGKSDYMDAGLPVHITAPYPFALLSDIAATATSPVVDVESGAYAGQALLDFYPSGLRDALDRLQNKVSFLITTEDATASDTVVGPDKSRGWESASITDLLFDGQKQENKKVFESRVLPFMKNGTAATCAFERSGDRIMLAYAPVHMRTLLPVGPSDFSNGVRVAEQLVYSVGIGVMEEELHAPFRTIEGVVDKELNVLLGVYVAVTVIVSVLFLVFTCIISFYISKPVIVLLRVVHHLNSGRVDGDLPPLQGGSREARRVYNTFGKLYKVVRISNAAFFSRNLKWAYHFVSDALLLFRKVNDRKAIGIACNNVANTLFAMIQETVDPSSPTCCFLPDACIISEALRHYDEAIAMAQHDFDNATADCSEKADYATQLADRVFNRGLFLLHVDGYDCAPVDARQRGYKDMEKARALDYDVKDFWLDSKLLLKNSSDYFCRLIRRIHGLADLYDDIGLTEFYDVKELVNDADQLLFAAWNEPAAPLFTGLTRVGRLQQLEGAAIWLSINMGNEIEAARLAMRMFSEDEYLLETSFARAAGALLRLMRDDDEVSFSERTASCVRVDLRKMIKQCKNVSVNIGRCLVFTVELSDKWQGNALLEKVNCNCLKLYDRLCAQDDYMAVVAYGVTDSLAVELGIRDENEGRQRTLLDIATQTTTERAVPAFPTAFQMVVDSQASVDRDSFVLIMLDGHAWDYESCRNIKFQIERLNRDRDTAIHLFVIGFDLDKDGDVRYQCEQLCALTKRSFYADASVETIDDTFAAIGAAITGVVTSSLDGVTMEKF